MKITKTPIKELTSSYSAGIKSLCSVKMTIVPLKEELLIRLNNPSQELSKSRIWQQMTCLNSKILLNHQIKIKLASTRLQRKMNRFLALTPPTKIAQRKCHSKPSISFSFTTLILPSSQSQVTKIQRRQVSQSSTHRFFPLKPGPQNKQLPKLTVLSSSNTCMKFTTPWELQAL